MQLIKNIGRLISTKKITQYHGRRDRKYKKTPPAPHNSILSSETTGYVTITNPYNPINPSSLLLPTLTLPSRPVPPPEPTPKSQTLPLQRSSTLPRAHTPDSQNKQHDYRLMVCYALCVAMMGNLASAPRCVGFGVGVGEGGSVGRD
jgi:hypothetical protein